MTITSRTLLITAAIMTAFTLVMQAYLPLLFMLLVSEMGAILCAIGIWMLWKEHAQGRPPRYVIPAAVFFLLFGVRFALVGLQLWPS